MPKGSRSYKKSTRRRHRRKPKMVLMKSPSHNFGPKQYAHIRETVEYQNVQANIMFNQNFTLGEFERAMLVSQNFKWVRPARVTYTYEPIFNTYQSNAATPGIPYLFLAMNRTQDYAGSQNTVPGNLLAQGVKPKKLVKIIKLSYVPNWCSPGLLGTSISNNNVQNIIQIGSKAEYGWVPTPNAFSRYSQGKTEGLIPDLNKYSYQSTGNSIQGFGGLGNNTPSITTNTVTYNGHYAFVEQINKLAQPVYKMTVTVDWVFKDSKYLNADGQTDMLTYDSSGNVIASDMYTGEVPVTQ